MFGEVDTLIGVGALLLNGRRWPFLSLAYPTGEEAVRQGVLMKLLFEEPRGPVTFKTSVTGSEMLIGGLSFVSFDRNLPPSKILILSEEIARNGGLLLVLFDVLRFSNTRMEGILNCKTGQAKIVFTNNPLPSDGSFN